MSSSKKQSKTSDFTVVVIFLIIAFVAILGGVWFFSYKAITNPGLQSAAKAALPLLLV